MFISTVIESQYAIYLSIHTLNKKKKIKRIRLRAICVGIEEGKLMGDVLALKRLNIHLWIQNIEPAKS